MINQNLKHETKKSRREATNSSVYTGIVTFVQEENVEISSFVSVGRDWTFTMLRSEKDQVDRWMIVFFF